MTEPTLSAVEKVAALERVLNSEMFRGAPQSRAFLAYVVTETLAGRGDRLSERTVGRRALDRPHDFDGRFDASVRVRGTRVRKALDAYYASHDDPVRIRLEPGQYAPVFERAAWQSTPHVDASMAIAVLEDAEKGLIGALSDELARTLGTFPDLRVVGPVPFDRDWDALAARLGVRFILRAALGTVGGKSVVEIVLFDAVSEATIWSARELLDPEGQPGWDVARSAIGVAGQIGDYTGVILTRSRQSSRRQQADEWRALQAYHDLFATGGRRAVLDAADELAAAVRGGYRSPVILARLAHCLAANVAYENSDDIDADLREASSLAREALAADPDSATAHLALSTVALVKGPQQETIEHAVRAAELAPHHPSILNTAGTLMALAGDWDRGIDAVREALLINPNLPGYMRYMSALDHLFAADDALALAEAALISTPTEEWGPYLRALALMGLGYRERAEAEMAIALRIDPTLFDNLDRPVSSWTHLTSAQLAVITERLRMFLPAM